MGRIAPKVVEPGHAPAWRRLLQGSFWSGTALVFSQGSTLLGNFAAARLLDREAFGGYAAILATVQLGSTVLTFGLGYMATKYVAELRGSAQERAGRILGACLAASWTIAVAGAAGLLLGAPLLATRAFGRPELTPILRLAAPALVFVTGNLGLVSALAGLSAFPALGRLGLWSGLAYVALVVAGLLTAGVPGAVLGMGAAAALQSVLGARLLLREAHRQGLVLRTRLAGEDRGIWRAFGLPGALSSLTAAPAIWLVQAAVVRQPGGLVQLGSYLVASNLMTAVLLLPNIVNSVGTPLLNERRGADDARGFERMFHDNLRVTLLAVLGGLLVVGLSGPLLLSLFGRGFRSSYPVLLTLLAATLPESLTIALNQLLQSRAKMWHALLAINLPRDLLMPLLAVLLAPAYGALGGALAYLAGRLVALGSMLLLVRSLRVAHADAPAAG
jgi:O-antigen/teichoic acid export membrane protein